MSLQNNKLHTKAGWSPFTGTRVLGKVAKILLHGKPVFENGQVLADPGSGRILT
jgi:dihydroorotase-like cyclic amidohydrolase